MFFFNIFSQANVFFLGRNIINKCLCHILYLNGTKLRRFWVTFNYPRTNWQNILSFCCYLFKNGPIPASFFFTFVFFDTDDSEYCRRLDLNDGNDRSANWATTTSLVDHFVSYSKMFNSWHLFHFWPYVQGFECAWSLHRVLLAKEPDHSYLLWFFELIRIFHNASLLKYSVTRWYK